jgi:glycosyltransferase involved in cell wall biosynthesis
MKIDILLATYNGEKYIKDQMESILNQSYSQFSVLIRDDGSTDRTIEIIKKYEEIYKLNLTKIHDDLGNLGSSKCFMELLKHSEADYIMFCDQDDTWLPNKVEITIGKLLELEEIYGTKTPILVFTDLKVVNKELNIISESFWKYQKLNPDISRNWKMLLANNVITGCTIMINRNAKEVVLPFKSFKMIYDHWLGVNVSKHGIVDYINTQTILYKQHGENVIGGHKFNLKHVFKKIINVRKLIQRIKIYYNFSKYFEISFSEFMFLQIKINLLRLLK